MTIDILLNIVKNFTMIPLFCVMFAPVRSHPDILRGFRHDELLSSPLFPTCLSP